MNNMKTLRICYLYRSLLFHRHSNRFKCEIEVDEKAGKEFSYIVN